MAQAKPGPSKNRSQFVSFKVYVYRLSLEGSFVFGPEFESMPLNNILYMDASDPMYRPMSDALLDDDDFENFLNTIRSGITRGLSGGPSRLLQSDSIFQRIDITPLVAAVRINTNIAGNNSCMLTMLDHSLTDFGNINIAAAGRMGPVYRELAELPPDPTLSKSEQDKQLKERMAASSGKISSSTSPLSGFALREFDLVRVEIFSRDDESWADRAEGFSNNNLSPDLTSTTGFTGLVSEMTRSAAVGSVPSIEVACLSMSSVFSRGTIVFDKAISQVITTKGGENLKVLNTDINVYANRFVGKSSLSVFLELVNDYFFIREPGKTGSPSAGDSDVSKMRAMHMPDIRQEFWDKVLTFRDEDGLLRETLVQFVPTLICYHILKYINLEPIAVLDDMLDDSRSFIAEPGSSTKLEMPAGMERSAALALMSPYLLMTRTSYENFDSSFMEPASVLEEIRSKSFFEIFEDRSGAFHFRFPRYNCSSIMDTCDEGNTISASLRKTDSGVFNVTQVETAQSFVGDTLGPRGLLAGVNFDRLSISRLGLRAPQKLTNPNALSPDIARAISRFIAGYNAALSSRTATVVRTIEPRINVGDMVRFNIGRIDKTKSPSGVSSGEPRTYVGYVASIDESIPVSGQASQTLGLVMVRPCGGEKLRPLNAMAHVPLRRAADLIRKTTVKGTKTRTVDLPGSALDFSAGTRAVSVFAYGGPDVDMVKVRELLGVARSDEAIDLNGAGAPDTTIKVSFGSLGTTSGVFQYIQDPFPIAVAAAPKIQELKDGMASLRGKDPAKMTAKEHAAAIKAADTAVRQRAEALAAGVLYSEFLARFLKESDARYQKGLGALSPGQFDKFVRNYANAVVPTYNELLKKFMDEIASTGGRSVSIKFPGDVTRVVLIPPHRMDISLDMIVGRAGGAYAGGGKRKGSDWYKKQFDELFRPGPSIYGPDGRYTHDDVKSASIIYVHLRNVVTRLISIHSLEEAKNDASAAEAVAHLNDTKSKAALSSATTKSIQNAPNTAGIDTQGSTTTFGVSRSSNSTLISPPLVPEE